MYFNVVFQTIISIGMSYFMQHLHTEMAWKHLLPYITANFHATKLLRETAWGAALRRSSSVLVLYFSNGTIMPEMCTLSPFE